MDLSIIEHVDDDDEDFEEDGEKHLEAPQATGMYEVNADRSVDMNDSDDDDMVFLTKDVNFNADLYKH